MHSNHGYDPAKSLSITQPDYDLKVFEEHRLSDHLYTLFLSMVMTMIHIYLNDPIYI